MVRWRFAAIDSNSPNPPAAGVFLVRCGNCADRGHSLGLEPLEESVSLLHFLSEHLGDVFWDIFVTSFLKLDPFFSELFE